MYAVIVLVVVGSTIWMGFDAYHAGRSWGSVIGWVVGALLVWIVAFPWYLVDRKRFAKAVDKGWE
jgi:uncharacterized membrane protein